jgi:hypothetical protein
LALRVEQVEPGLRSRKKDGTTADPSRGLRRTRLDDGGRATVVSGFIRISLAKNNQLRTGADKGNPTV